MCKLCVFAGTREGRALIERIAGRGAEVTACVATEYGEVLLGGASGVEIRAGRMDEAEMIEFLRAGAFDLVVDATHPYAERVTENIVSACQASGREYLRLLRAAAAEGADGRFFPDSLSCAEYLSGTEGKILLATGSKDLSVFCGAAGLRQRLYVRVLPMVRSLEICADCGIAPDRILAMQGPFDEEMNLAMLRATGAKFLVTKDGGSTGGYPEKKRAAERAGAELLVIGRPPQREGLGLTETIAQIEARFMLRSARKRVALIGIGLGDPDTRTLGMESALMQADCVIGARRMLDSIDLRGRETHAAIAPEDIARAVESSACRDFAVLFSGDTGFYSGARKLAQRLTGAELRILPGISSLQGFCARIQRPWEDVRPISLHGRETDLVREVQKNPAVFALLGGADGAHDALSRLERAGLGALRAYVGQNMGYIDERIFRGSVSELLSERFDSLSVLLVENPDWGKFVVTHGLPDEAFERDEVPMTKSEVRSISLSKLRLTQSAVVYDVGAGSGSCAAECALQLTSGRVYAIERKEKALALIARNAEKLGLCNLEVVAGEAPDALRDLPAPTHAFIGGSSGNLHEIIRVILAKNPETRIVVNAVTLETLAELSAIAPEFEYSEIVQVNLSRARALGRYQLMTAQNPVAIATFQGARAKGHQFSPKI